jgi:restriction system protein
MSVPKYDEMYNEVLNAIKTLGGSASNQELENEVAKLLKLSDSDLAIIQENHNRTQFSYRLAWTKTHLKYAGYLDNTERGVWGLTQKGKSTPNVNKEEVNRVAKAEQKKQKLIKHDEAADDEEEAEGANWKDTLTKIIKNISADAFERLCQRFLRESGFIEVEVTGRAGDGGIDGHGVVKLGGLLSFHVYFQAKRYKDSVPSSVIRDFRGAMAGRADKGLIITTGVFTRDAIQEAQRAGTIPIDLIDGNELSEKLKNLHIGINVKQKYIEEVEINETWYKQI